MNNTNAPESFSNGQESAKKNAEEAILMALSLVQAHWGKEKEMNNMVKPYVRGVLSVVRFEPGNHKHNARYYELIKQSTRFSS